MSTYRAYQVTGQRQFELVVRELRASQPAHARIRVDSCGVCHSDVLAVEGMRPDPQQPMVTGHEAVGVIDAVGDGVTEWQVGDRVGVGYLGGHCGVCAQCRHGDFVNCENQPQTGVDASPLRCAAITTYNPLQKLNAAPDALVAVQGIGGLGHLGVRYANKLGYRAAAIAWATDKGVLAEKLGAHHYIDSTAVDPAQALQELGGAAAILATAAGGASMSPLLGGLAPRGQLIVVGVGTDPIEVNAAELIFGGRSVVGSLTGTPIENEANLQFSTTRGVTAMNEVLPFEEAPAAYARMMSGHARFRVVLDISGN